MNSDINCSIKGSYKVDLFSGGKFVESTDWFSNTITNTGLLYPFSYSFAKCSSFLSLGATQYGSIGNAQTGTGVINPIASFPVYDSTFTGSADQPNSTGYYNQSGQYIGWQAYEIGGPHNSSFAGSVSSACGTKFTNQGLNFYRAWTLPTGATENGAIIAGTGLLINSFAVSPASGSDHTGKYA